MVGISLTGLRWQPMASGHLCLILTDRIGWHDFPEFADKLVSDFGWEVAEKFGSVVMHIWILKFQDGQLKLVFDDFPLTVSLESDSHEGDEIIKSLAIKMTNTTMN